MKVEMTLDLAPLYVPTEFSIKSDPKELERSYYRPVTIPLSQVSATIISQLCDELCQNLLDKKRTLTDRPITI